VLADSLGVKGAWSILGSDISTQVLATAERGHYWLERTRGLPDAYLRKYCLRGVRSQEGSFLIAPELRSHTRFMQINLNTTLPDIGRFHVVFLRNVMIYFDNDTNARWWRASCKSCTRRLPDCWPLGKPQRHQQHGAARAPHHLSPAAGAGQGVVAVAKIKVIVVDDSAVVRQVNRKPWRARATSKCWQPARTRWRRWKKCACNGLT